MQNSDFAVALIAFLVTAAASAAVRRLACRFRVYDDPGPLKIHQQPIPRLGGVAILMGLSAGLLLAHTASAGISFSFYWVLLPLWLTGLLDDLFDVSPYARLLLQVVVGIALYGIGWRVFPFTAGWLAPLAVVLFLVLYVNAFNMLDGADGLAAGVAAIIAGGYLWLGYSANDPSGVALGAGLLGACGGFLLFNFPPAKMFMGDSGSTLLGFMVALLAMNFSRNSGAPKTALAISILFAAIPIADALFAFARRVVKGRSPFLGDREHTYDLLLRSGWHSDVVAFFYYVVTGGLVTLGLLAS